MSWNEVSIMSQREEFIRLATQEQAQISLLCRRFGISRKTGYKWIDRSKNGAAEGFEDRSKRPVHSPNRTKEEMERSVLAVRDEHPTWGGRKIHRRLTDLDCARPPAPSTITAILHRHERIAPEESRKRGPMERFERQCANELWQMDFKGHFQTNTVPCHPLTVVDDFSRYALGVRACADQRAETVRAALIDIFRLYGLPEHMLMDNGSCWGQKESRYTVLTIWLLRIGLRLSHSRSYHPQTQGKNERFNRTLKEDAIAGRNYHDLVDCQNHFDRFRRTYNQERPHEALDLKTPASRYQVSPFTYPEVLPTIEYLSGDTVRKVGPAGYISYRKERYQIGRAFAGEPVALRSTNRDGELAVYYCHAQVAVIDLTTGTFQLY